MSNRQYHFSIGVIDVSLRSACDRFIQDYLSLYATYVCPTCGPDAVDVEIRARRRYPWARGPYTLRSIDAPDFQLLRHHEVLPHLEWYINWQIIQKRLEYVQLHASSLELDGQAMILPGDPGSGKSTLTAGLLTRGWSYLCDEFALVDPRTGTIHPYPRALCIKEPSFAVIRCLGLPLRRRTPYHKATKGPVAFLNPLDVSEDIVGRPSPVRWVVFPKYVPGAKAILQPIARSQAAYLLAKQCFNIRVDQQRTLRILAAIARGADCYQLTAGDIHATCDQVESLTYPVASRKVG
jgi:HprK-related kinase A